MVENKFEKQSMTANIIDYFVQGSNIDNVV